MIISIDGACSRQEQICFLRKSFSLWLPSFFPVPRLLSDVGRETLTKGNISPGPSGTLRSGQCSPRSPPSVGRPVTPSQLPLGPACSLQGRVTLLPPLAPRVPALSPERPSLLILFYSILSHWSVLRGLCDINSPPRG